MAKGEHSSPAGGTANLYNPYGKQCGDLFKDSKLAYHLTQSYHCGVYTTRFILSQIYMHIYVYCSTFHNSQDLETTQMFLNWLLDDKTVVHVHNGVLGSGKERWHHWICRYMSGSHYAKWSNTPPTNREWFPLFVDASTKYPNWKLSWAMLLLYFFLSESNSDVIMWIS